MGSRRKGPRTNVVLRRGRGDRDSSSGWRRDDQAACRGDEVVAGTRGKGVSTLAPASCCLPTNLCTVQSSVDAEWIAAKKDWQEAKRKFKAQEKGGKTENGRARATAESSQSGVREDTPPHYQPEMDDMPCILYTHGGKVVGLDLEFSVNTSYQVATTSVALTRNDTLSSGLQGRLMGVFSVRMDGYMRVASVLIWN